MRIRAGIIGAAVAGLALSAHASIYSSMAVPGDHNGWSTTPSMVLVGGAGNVWVCTQTISSASGSFKFAANGSWTTNWGGSASITRVPAVASAPTLGGGNLAYSGFSNGPYRITFNDSTLEFQMEWAGVSPLPGPVYSNMSFVGAFNGWRTGVNLLTNHPGNTDLWSISLDLFTDTSFQIWPNDTWANQYGAPVPTTVIIPGLNMPVTNHACGKSDYALSGITPGTFRFELNTSNATFTVAQTQTNSLGPLATVSAVGDFVAGSPPDVNLENIGGSSWRSDFNVTNTTRFTLSFIGRDANGAPVRYWGATNTSTNTIPFTGFMQVSSSNSLTNITVTADPGNYRITLDSNSGEFIVQQRYTLASGVNYLQNPSFETLAYGVPANWGVYHATSGEQSDFGAHSGSRCGVLMAKTIDTDPDLGNFDQTTATLNNLSGSTFRVSAIFRTKGDWQAETVRIIVEWWSGTNRVAEYSTEITGLSEYWRIHALECPVPNDSVAAKILLKYDGVPGTGYLLVDDVEARIAATRFQDFNAWGNISVFQRIAPDWEATSGKTLYNVPGAEPTGGVIISKYIEGGDNNKAIEIFNGTGSAIDLAAGQYYLQQYNNGATGPTVNVPLWGSLAAGETLIVSRLGTPTNAYPPDPEILTAGFNRLQTNTVTFNGDDVVVLRRSGTNGPVVDRVGQVGTNAAGSIWARYATDHSLYRKHSVLWGTTNQLTNAFPLSEWTINAKDDFSELGIHFLSLEDPNAPYIPTGYSLLLNTNASLLTPELDGGIGDISFYARAQGALAGNNLQIAIESSDSTTSSNWTLIETISIPLSTTNFTLFTSFATVPADSVLRIRHIGDGTTNRIRIDNVSVASAYSVRRTENFATWTNYLGSSVGTYSLAEWTIQNAQIGTNGYLGSVCADVYPETGSVTSPTFDGGVGTVNFWLSQLPQDRGEVLASVLTSTNGWTTWVTNATIALPAPSGTNILKTNASVSIYLPVASSARISASGSPSPFVVDNVEVRIPSISRVLDFNDFQTSSSYLAYNKDGWIITKTAITTNLVYSGNSGLLQNGSITSPYIDEIGTISFYYRMGPYSGDYTAQLTVEISANGSNWTLLNSGIVPSSEVALYSYFNTNTLYHYVRITQTTKDKRILIDQISIGEPSPIPSCTITAALSPPTPAPDEGFYLTANVIPLNGADIISVTGSYRIASGVWINLPLAQIGYGAYRSELLPPRPAGTKISSKASVQYAGPGAAPGSTTYTTNTAYSTTNVITISDVKKGTVWINEIFYAPYEGEEGGGVWGDTPYNHEFIELCGVAGTSITNWKVQLLFASASDIQKNGGQALYATYTIPSGTILSNTANGFGFYVVGDQELTTNHPVNQALTVLVPASVNPYAADDHDHIHDPSGVIRLLDNYGNVVYSLSYGAYASGSERILAVQDLIENTNSLSLSGTGSFYSDFSWNDDGALTIGAENTGQILQPDAGLPFMGAWHTPDAIAQTSLQGTFSHFHPIRAAQSDNLFIHYAYTNSAFVYASIGGRVHHHKQGSAGDWSISSKLTDFPGNYDTNGTGFAYVRMAAIAPYSYDRKDVMEYVIEAIPNNPSLATAWLGSNGEGSSAAYESLEEAKLYPFRYTFPISDPIEITKITISNTLVRLETYGNDTLDPIVNFNIRFATNLLIPTWEWPFIEPLFVSQTNEQNYFTFTNPPGGRNFFAIEPLWP